MDQRYLAEHKYVQINVLWIHKVRRGRRLEDFKSDGWGQKGPSTADEVTPHQSGPPQPHNRPQTYVSQPISSDRYYSNPTMTGTSIRVVTHWNY